MFISADRTITVADVPSDVAFGEGVTYSVIFHDVTGEITRFQNVKPHDYDLLTGTLVRMFPIGYDCPACKHGDRLSIFARHQPYIEDCPPEVTP